MAENATQQSPAWLKRFSQLGGRTIIIIIALLFVVAAADRSRLSWDWSADHRYSLSPALITLLTQQTDSVEFVTIWPMELDEAARPISDGLRTMSEQSRHIRVRHIDPILHKSTLSAFEKEYGSAMVPALYVLRPTQKRSFHIPINAGTRLVLQREIGGALISLQDNNPPVIAFLQGHGELRPAGGADDGADELIHAFTLGGFRVTLTELARGDRIPNDALLCLAGPTAPLGSDITAIKNHLTDGGALMLFGDDRLPLDLALFLRTRGILMGPALPTALPAALRGERDFVSVLQPHSDNLTSRIIVSLRHHVVGQEAQFPHHNLFLDGDVLNHQHQVLQRVGTSGQPLISPWSTAIHILQPQQFDQENDTAIRQSLLAAYATFGTAPFAATRLAHSVAGDAWLKERSAPFVVPEQLAQQPTIPCAWALTMNAHQASVSAQRENRLFLWGSRQAASDGILLQQRFANSNAWVDAARWAMHREQANVIPEAETKAFRVDASDSALLWIAALLIAVIPCLCIGAAILTWWDRR
jgi:ABC-type uncharacterized transport system